MLKSFKNRFAVSLYPLARLYIKNFPIPAHKPRMWNLIRRTIGWRSSVRSIRTDHGFVVQGDVAEYHYLCLYFFGVWEENITRFVASRLTGGDCFIDIGAHIGYYSLLSASLVGNSGRVVAVEASPRTYRDLVRNLQLNRAVNVRAVNVAASDSPGELDLFEAPEESRGRTTTSATWARQSDCQFAGRTRALPLGSIASREEMRQARLIKVDVEGAEWAVCTGLLPFLGELRRDAEIILELTPSELHAQGHTPEQFIERFAAGGFFPYVLENRYSVDYFLSGPKKSRPARLKDFRLEQQTDLVFSRTDAAHL